MAQLRIVYTETITREVVINIKDDTNPLNHEFIARQALVFVDEPLQIKSKATSAPERTFLRIESIPG